MNWIVKMFQSAGSGSNGKDSVMAMPKRSQMLDAMTEEGAMGTLTVVAIRNGFLVTRRVYNPNGPDRIEATYAANADDLGPQIIAELAQLRLTK
jgi:hypothetical protein